MSNGAKRQQLYAERQKNGLIVIPCICVEQDIIAVLRATGFLDQDEPSRAQLADALSRWIYAQMTREVQRLFPSGKTGCV